MMEYEYLTEKELEQLISDVEAEGLTPAPPELLDDVMHTICQREEEAKTCHSPSSYLEPEERRADTPPKVTDPAQKRKEYRRYCIQVGCSVAAVAALVLLYTSGVEVQTRVVPTKEEVVLKQVPTKEEVLDKQTLTSKLYESHRFSDMWQNGLFK